MSNEENGSLKEVEIREILRALNTCRTETAAAVELGIDRSTLTVKKARHKITRVYIQTKDLPKLGLAPKC